MGSFKEHIAEETVDLANKKIGSTFWLSTTILCQGISVTTLALTQDSQGGELVIEDVILRTDATGLAGGTTFKLVSTNIKGTTLLVQEAVANLAGNVTVDLDSVRYGVPGIYNAGFDKSRGSRMVLENQKKICVQGTGAFTGNGKIDVYIKFRRLADYVDLKIN